MSWQATSWVYRHSLSRHSSRLVLLCIADHAHDDGTNSYPSVSSICRETLLGERIVQQSIADLVSIGELRAEYGKGPRGTYRFSLAKMQEKLETDPAKFAPRKVCAPQSFPTTPAKFAPEPSLESLTSYGGGVGFADEASKKERSAFSIEQAKINLVSLIQYRKENPPKSFVEASEPQKAPTPPEDEERERTYAEETASAGRAKPPARSQAPRGLGSRAGDPGGSYDGTLRIRRGNGAA